MSGFRPAQPHFGFGGGAHACLGANLARLEASLWVNKMLDDLTDFGIDYTRAPDGIPIRGILVRSPASIPVSF